MLARCCDCGKAMSHGSKSNVDYQIREKTKTYRNNEKENESLTNFGRKRFQVGKHRNTKLQLNWAWAHFPVPYFPCCETNTIINVSAHRFHGTESRKH